MSRRCRRPPRRASSRRRSPDDAGRWRCRTPGRSGTARPARGSSSHEPAGTSAPRRRCRHTAHRPPRGLEISTSWLDLLRLLNVEFDATVVLPALVGVVGIDGLLLPEAEGVETLLVDA